MRTNSIIAIIEIAGVSLPENLGRETFEKAKAFIAPFIEYGQTLTDLLNKLQAHQVHFERATETENEPLELRQSGLSLRNYSYQFSDNQDDIALLQCVVRIPTTSEFH